MEQNHGGYGLINKSISEAVLEAALRTGGDFSELYMQDTEFNTVKMVDGAVDNASYERKAGAGVRVLKGTRSAYAYTANTSESALIAAAKAAASALNEAKEFEAYQQIDPETVGKEASRIAITMLHAPECPAGMVPVVIDGGFGGVILHEACVHGLEATSVGRGNSVFCNKLGQKIASDIVTAVDDGTMPGEWGSMCFDDEGHPAQRNVLIENGVLKSYLVDILGSRLMNHPVTGSGRRQDYTYAPTSRMTNTFFAEGNDDEEAMLATMGDGLFAAKMGGGSVNPLTGEFNFAVLEGYWVKNGKILCPVRGATLIGKGADVLMKIDRIGRRMWMGQGMCGSSSGSVPTNVGQPRIRVSEITVGGKGGAL